MRQNLADRDSKTWWANQVIEIASMPGKIAPIAAQVTQRDESEDKAYACQCVDKFCRQWIPKLYRVYSQEDNRYNRGYKQACITELMRLLVSDYPIKYQTIYYRWHWENYSTGYVPLFLPAVLRQADKLYRIQESLGKLPRYEIEVFD